MAAEYGELLAEAGSAESLPTVGGGITLEFLAGGVGIVLGILSFAAAHGAVLNLVGLLAVGAGMLMTGATSVGAAVGHTRG